MASPTQWTRVWASRDTEGRGNLACCNPWGHKEWDLTWWLMLGKRSTSSPPGAAFSKAQPSKAGWFQSLLPSSHCWHYLAASLPLMECVLQLGIRSSVIHLIAFYELGSDTREWSGLTSRSFPWCEREKRGKYTILNNQILYAFPESRGWG